MDGIPAWVQPLIDRVNWSKHFGPKWPPTLCDSHDPDWDREQFLEQVDFDNLVAIASSMRDGTPCEIVGEHLGMYNCVYYLVFEDGTQWVARIPLMMRQFQCDDEETESLVQHQLFKSMIASQTFARRKKGVFAPTIYGSFVDGNNPVGVPFILMQTIVGWRTDEVIGHMNEELRPVFSDLAREMVSLASPPYFTKIGSLFQNGEDYQVGPLLSQSSLQDDPIVLDQRGPFSTVEEYFVTALNRHTATALRDQDRALYIQSTRLRVLVSHFIDPRYNEGPFILSPFDWDARDIFSETSGAVNGILDWDFAQVVPLQSYFRYPPFMTRDWITGSKSPVMEHYRRMFRDCLAELQDETELPLLELLDQSRWFQMLDEGVQSSEAGKQALSILEAYVAAASDRKLEVKPIPVIKVMPVLKDIRSGGK